MRLADVLGLIMGGGQGARLYPLTRDRSKPAVPLAGKYRLIDIPMSNCFHAGIEKIAILTQFNSVSLHRHIYRTYTRDMFTQGWVQILAAEQTPRSGDWYQGTADAVRKQVVEIREAQPKYVLILAGDHLYRMDYGHFVQRHIETGAEVTIAVQPVVREEVSGLGILKLDEHNQIARFVEKPKSEAELEGLESRTDSDKPYMASMGIYVFATDLLFELLEAEGDDFGSEIIPAAIQDRRVMGYVFDGYWEDIGTIQRFFEVNLAIASPETEFDFYSPERPIYTRARFLPTSEIVDSTLDEVLLTDGCRIHGARVESAVVGLRSIISPEVSIKSTILMGADFYEMDEAKAENKQLGRPEVGVGPGSIIERAIIDKNARIGRNVKIRSLPNRLDTDGENWVSREGIVIVPKNAIIPDGAVI
jgi:glucose-1-phosphate adenylyltransferase